VISVSVISPKSLLPTAVVISEITEPSEGIQAKCPLKAPAQEYDAYGCST